MRKKLIIGNWKMNFNMQEASLYLHKLMNTLPSHRDVEVVLAPTILTLQSLSLQINRRIAKLAAQNCYWRDSGAYTGEIPAAHLRGIADYVIIGHSERRYIFIESEKRYSTESSGGNSKSYSSDSMCWRNDSRKNSWRNEGCSG